MKIINFIRSYVLTSLLICIIVFQLFSMVVPSVRLSERDVTEHRSSVSGYEGKANNPIRSVIESNDIGNRLGNRLHLLLKDEPTASGSQDWLFFQKNFPDETRAKMDPSHTSTISVTSYENQSTYVTDDRSIENQTTVSILTAYPPKVSFLWDIPVDVSIRDIALGDLDGDHINDVVACVVRYEVGWSIVAARGFDGSILWNSSVSDKVGEIETGNLTDDIFVDVVAGDWYGNLFALDGKDGRILWNLSLGLSVSDLKISDLNEDGQVEIIVAVANQIIVLNRDGTQLWAFTENISSPTIALGKFNGDNVTDVATVARWNSKNESATLFIVDGTNGSELWQYSFPTFNVTDSYLSTNDVTSGDFNGDFEEDVAVVVGLNGTQSQTTYRVYAFKGTSGSMLWTYTSNMPSFGAGLASGDLNNDGVDDVVRFGNVPIVALDGGSGAVLWESSYASAEDAAIFDLNGDGNGEVIMGDVVISGISGEIIIGLPRKEGETNIGGVKRIAVGDITGDGWSDIVTGHHPSTGVRAFKVEPAVISGSLQIVEPTNSSVIAGSVAITFTIENTGDDIEFLQGDSSNRIDLEIEYRSIGGNISGWGIVFWSSSYNGLTLRSGETYTETVVYDPSRYEGAVPPGYVGDAPYGETTIRLVHWKQVSEQHFSYGEFGVHEIKITLIPPSATINILYDWGHSEHGVGWDQFQKYLAENRYNVTTTTSELTNETLSHYDVLIITVATKPFSNSEIDAVVGFVENGGGLLLLGEDRNWTGYLPAMNPLASRFGFTFNNDDGGGTRPLLDHPITEGVTSITYRVGCTINLTGPGIVLFPGPALVAVEHGLGRVVGFGNGQTLYDADLFNEDNLQLGMNLIGWLSSSFVLSPISVDITMDRGSTSSATITIRDASGIDQTASISFSGEATILSNISVRTILLPANQKANFTLNIQTNETHSGFYQGLVDVSTELGALRSIVTIGVRLPVVATERSPNGPLKILYDMAHGEIDPTRIDLFSWLEKTEMSVFYNSAPLTLSLLSNFTVLVIVVPQAPFSSMEIEAINLFVKNGGGLFLVGTSNNFGGSANWLNEISKKMGVLFNNDYTNGRPAWTNERDHVILFNTSRVVFDGGCTLRTVYPVEELIHTGTGAYGAVLASLKYGDDGRVVFIGDWSTLNYNHAHYSPYDNLQLLRNVLAWLSKSVFLTPDVYGVPVESQSQKLTFKILSNSSLIRNVTIAAHGDVAQWVYYENISLGMNSVVLPAVVGINWLELSLNVPMETQQGRYGGRLMIGAQYGNVTVETVVEVNVGVRLPKILYDMGHGEYARYGGIRYEDEAARWLIENGYRVDIASTQLDTETLQCYDILMISLPMSVFSNYEINAIHDFVSSGGRLFVLAGWWGTTDVDALNPLMADFGIIFNANYGWDWSPPMTIHPHFITQNVTELWYYGRTMNVTAPAEAVVTNSIGQGLYAVSYMGMGKVVATGTFHEICEQLYFRHNFRIFINIIEWLDKRVRYEHDLTVTLKAPEYMLPETSVRVNVSVYNVGLSDEFDVEVQFIVDNALQDSAIILAIMSLSHTEIEFTWYAPTTQGVYNLTVYVLPVLGETNILNNDAVGLVKVARPIIHPLEGQWANYIWTAYNETGEPIGTAKLNFTYARYVSPYQINVTMWFEDPYGTSRGWMIVNIITRMVEEDSGIHWAGMWYPGWIETHITIGSTINLLQGTATVVGSRTIEAAGLLLDCWELEMQYSSNNYTVYYTFWYDKVSGLWVSMEWYQTYYPQPYRMYLILVDTNVPIGQAFKVETDKPMYGRNEIATITTIYRIGNMGVENATVLVEVNYPNGTLYFMWTMTTDANGTASVTFLIEENAPYGNYTVYATAYKVGMAEVVATTTFIVGFLEPRLQLWFEGPDVALVDHNATMILHIANVGNATAYNVNGTLHLPLDGELVALVANTTFTGSIDAGAEVKLLTIVKASKPYRYNFNGTAEYTKADGTPMPTVSAEKTLIFAYHVKYPIDLLNMTVSTEMQVIVVNLTIINYGDLPVEVTLIASAQHIVSKYMLRSANQTVIINSEETLKVSLTINIPSDAPSGEYMVQGILATGLPREGGFTLTYMEEKMVHG